MKKYFISIILALSLNAVFAQLNVLSNGYVGVGGAATTPSANFQIGDRWTFMDFGTKVMGYNVFCNPGDTRLFSGAASCLRMDDTGIKFGIASSAGANVSLTSQYMNLSTDWKFPLFLLTNGSIQINGNTNISGSAYCSSGYWSGSDEKLKENIKPIEKATDIILSLNGKTYNLKSDNLKSANGTKRNSYGLIAQELEKVLPDLVAASNDSTKLLAVNYDGLVPILIEAFKEQKLTIDSLKQLINSNSINNSSIQTSTLVESSLSQAKLAQNNPNPFSQSTNIGFYLPEIVQNATINIYDLNGLQVKSFPITSKGNGAITINGYELRSGIYLYTLIADGKEVATKRMILTQ